MKKKDVRIPKQKRSIEKKERIIKAAFHVFNQKGYFGTSTAEIAKEADLSTGSVYAYFSDKKDILLACLYQFGDIFIQNLKEAFGNISANDDMLEVVKNILRVSVESHTHNRIYHDEVMSLHYRDLDVRKYFTQTQKAVTAIILDQIKVNGYTFLYPNEQSFIIYQLVEGLEDELVFDHSPDIDHEVLLNECAGIIYSLLVKIDA